MKKFVGAILVAIISLMSLTGCSAEAKAAKAAAQLKQQVDTLVVQGDKDRSDGNLDAAVTAYTSAVGLKADAGVQAKLDGTKKERQAVEIAKKFRTQSYDIYKNRTRTGIAVGLTEMSFVIKDLQKLVAEFESIDTNEPTDIARYVGRVKDSLDYKLAMIEVKDETGSWKDTGRAEGLGYLSPQLGFLNTFQVATARNTLNKFFEHLDGDQLPSKYK